MKTKFRNALITAICGGVVASAQVALADAPDMWRAKGLTPPGYFFSGKGEQSGKPVTIGVYKSGQGIGKSTPSAAKVKKQHHSSAVTVQPDVSKVKGLSKPDLQ